MQTEEVKPVRCGCGGEALISTWTGSNATVVNDCTTVYCEKCGMQTRIYRTESEAIEAWNRAMGADRGFDEWCTDCKEYDHDKHCCPRWNRVIKNCVNEVREKYDERTAKVEKVDMPSEHNKVYKCSECGQYTHRTSWSSPVNYCTNCGARLEWK